MVREIIQIDEELCNGCGECVPGCPEGALRIIDGKARLVGDLLCDGLGACIGNCPTGALTVEKREAEPYDERIVMESMISMGANTIVAHLEHLNDHGENENIELALAVIAGADFDDKAEVMERWKAVESNGNGLPGGAEHSPGHAAVHVAHHGHASGGCPGSATRSFQERENAGVGQVAETEIASALTHWPVQMHLLNPAAPHFAGRDFVLAADCTAFSFGAFHRDFLAGKCLGIACPKLDDGQQVYVDKIKALIDQARINTLTVVMMQVPCCGGLLHLAKMAASEATRKVPVKQVIVGIEGQILDESWV